MMKKAISLILILCLCLCTGICASAADIGEDGGSALTPVTLTTTNDGIGGKPGTTATRLSVTVPTTLPLAMSDDGTVTTATNSQIVNHSYGSVRVRSVTVSAANGWRLTAFDNKSSLASEKVNANKIGFALTVGSGKQVKTGSGNTGSQSLIGSPVAGCYMTGAGNASDSKVLVNYDAIITPLNHTMDNVTIASVVFVVEWDTV